MFLFYYVSNIIDFCSVFKLFHRSNNNTLVRMNTYEILKACLYIILYSGVYYFVGRLFLPRTSSLTKSRIRPRHEYSHRARTTRTQMRNILLRVCRSYVNRSRCKTIGLNVVARSHDVLRIIIIIKPNHPTAAAFTR